MRRRIGVILVVLVVAAALPLSAQPPGKPPLPSINPATARLEQTIGELGGAGFAIAYSEPRETLIAASENGTIQTWSKDVLVNVRSGSGSANVLRGHNGAVLALAWEDAALVSAGVDRKLLFWDVREGKILHTGQSAFLVRVLAMSPDSKTVAAAGEDKSIQLWNADTGKPGPKLEDHEDWVTSLAYSTDGKFLASGDWTGKVALWEMPEGKKIRNLPAPPMPPPKTPPDATPATALAFSPDGKTLALGQGDGVIQLINPADGKIIRPMPGHTSAVTGIAWHPSGTLIASSSKDRTIRLWNPANGQMIKALEGHNAWAEGVVFLLQGTRLASVSADQTVRIWDLSEPPKK